MKIRRITELGGEIKKVGVFINRLRRTYIIAFTFALAKLLDYLYYLCLRRFVKPIEKLLKV